ncbi:hypothetical protein FHS95_003159 [Sphingomonas naasensis]|uniref:Uncharacterized protein n=1 Tax=Sphingomonas naasensis TaxID=1344951 RepID=A0A4S1WIH8_9SPHN|nr:hypothetical protein [Sphingomonas naasensis]NIJ21456.1 hypothetical protein [Sphingomonas naasensis]TGX41587.1 hypothetical protein E5A74_13315 [Sphingomonas naasensis]
MDQILYVLAIMGCSDDSMQCQQARVEPVRYTSVQACQEAMPAALQRNADIDYPVISAACQRQGGQMVDARRASARPGT